MNQDENQKIKVAVIGYGHLGKWHCQKVELFSEDVEFYAIIEKNPLSQEEARKKHPDVIVTDDLDSVIDHINAAIIVTPTSTHYELTDYLLSRHIHVFCEKPLCTSTHEAIKLSEKVKESDLILQVGHSERFHQIWKELKNQLLNLKPPFSLRVNRIAPFKGRATDVDVVQDLAIHDLDLLRFLFDTEIKSLKARGHKMRTDYWDHVSITLELENLSDAQIVIGRNGVQEKRDWEITTKDGMIFVDLLHHRISYADTKSQDVNNFVQSHSYEKKDHLFLEHQDFYQAIKNKSRPTVDVNDGAEAVKLVNLVLKALKYQDEG